jgi:UDP-glucose 4-epimerase
VLTDKRVVVTGGTGSLGNALVRRLLTGEIGLPREVVVFSRDEAKQHAMRLAFENRSVATDEVIYERGRERLRFRIGDVSDYHSVCGVLRDADVVYHAAALKQVPTCEYHPYEAVKTNVLGPENIVRAIREHGFPVEVVIGVSTDKACKPVNVMGMTKAIQERILVQANLDCSQTRFVVARYGNVLASRGSVLPLFHEQIKAGGPVTITTTEMTRFLLSLERAVDIVFAATREGNRGETFIPRLPSALVTDIASLLIDERPIETKVVGIRPGEKIHEILISEEEAPRTVERGDHLAILPILPQLRVPDAGAPFGFGEYNSMDQCLDREGVSALLRDNHLFVEDDPTFHA